MVISGAARLGEGANARGQTPRVGYHREDEVRAVHLEWVPTVAAAHAGPDYQRVDCRPLPKRVHPHDHDPNGPLKAGRLRGWRDDSIPNGRDPTKEDGAGCLEASVGFVSDSV